MMNDLFVFVARRRWLKRIVRPFLPPMAKKTILENIEFHFDPRDMRGPSFHFAYDLEKGFLNYEQKEKNALLKLIPDDGVFYDIGANIGLYSVYFAFNKPNIKIFCFEPNGEAFKCLEKTVSSMGKGNFHLIKKALGSQSTEKKLYQSSSNAGGHTFNAEEQGVEKGENNLEVVQVATIDELFFNRKISGPNAIKIDVEGFELEVLKGAIKTIKEFQPTMLIECSNKNLALKGKLWQFFKDFEKKGLFVCEPSNLLRIDLNELSKIAQEKVNLNTPLSNYFFQFDNKT